LKADVKGRMVRLPDFLIVGAAKSGTTSLYYYLKQHPQIFMPDMKEPLFFAFSGQKPPYQYPLEIDAIWSITDYINLFYRAGENQILGEASPLYLAHYKESISNMKKYIPKWKNLKIIIILRNPVERAWSQYRSFVMLEFEHLSFENALDKIQERLANNWRPGFDYTELGFFYEQVKAYMDTFPNVMVSLFEDLQSNALGLVKDIFHFLNVNDTFEPDVGEKYNPTGRIRSRALHNLLKKPNLVSSIFPLVKIIPLRTRALIVQKLKFQNMDFKKKSEMKEETRQYLKDLYRDDILKLQELIGKDLSAWLK